MASSTNTTNTDRQRKQRRNLSLEDKVNIIKRKETDAKLSDEKLANEYVNVDNGLVNTQLLMEDEIFEEFLIAEGVLQQVHVEENSSDEEEDAISVQMGREALELAKKFLEQREFTTESDIRYI